MTKYTVEESNGKITWSDDCVITRASRQVNEIDGISMTTVTRTSSGRTKTGLTYWENVTQQLEYHCNSVVTTTGSIPGMGKRKRSSVAKNIQSTMTMDPVIVKLQ